MFTGCDMSCERVKREMESRVTGGGDAAALDSIVRKVFLKRGDLN